MTLANRLHNGLWHNNPVFSQYLGLCPLLAVSTSFVTALGLGAATLVTLLASHLIISLIRHHISHATRLPLFVVVIASIVSCLQFVLHAFFFSQYQSLGLFLSLITTNCLIMARIESVAYRNPIWFSVSDAVGQGLGFLLALVVLGGLREWMATGCIFSGMGLVSSDTVIDRGLCWSQSSNGLLLLQYPTGAFMLLGCLLAIKQYSNTKK